MIRVWYPPGMEPTAYAKGDRIRIVTSVKEKVAAEFEGFAPSDRQGDVSRSDLQAQAKELGIPANQSTAKLLEAIGNFTPEGTENASIDTPDTDA